MKSRTIQKHLKTCSKEELVQLFLELARHNPAVERFLISRFDPTAPLPDFEDYEAEVRREFFPARGFGNANPSIIFRMLQRVEAQATSPKQVIDFIYFCIEMGVDFTDTYGDIDEEFYMAFEDLFERAAKLASTEKLIDEYEPRACGIVKRTYEMGWGFYDELERIFTSILRPLTAANKRFDRRPRSEFLIIPPVPHAAPVNRVVRCLTACSPKTQMK